MFKNLKIGNQIGLGIALILLVSAGVAAFAIFGLHKSADRFSEYRMFARESVLSGRVQANMLIASNAVSDFLYTRDESHADIFNTRFSAARDFALEQQTLMDDPRRLEMSRELVQSLSVYDDKAQEVFALMRRRDVILQQLLNPQGVRMRKNLTEIMVSANRDQDSESAYLAGRALEHVLLGRVHLLRFLEDNEEKEVLRVREELGSGFEQAYTEMANSIENPERQDRLRDFSSAREIYLGAFEEMVTLIDKRNQLVDRQLHPLDRSISDTAERIKLSLKDTQDTLGPMVQSDNDTTVRAVVLGSCLGAVLAIFIAWSIIRAITRPVEELVQTVGDVRESGDLSDRLSVQGGNELGAMAETLNGFLSSLEDKARIAKDVAEGKLDTSVALLSGRDTLGHSLQDMLGTLKENEIESASRDWIRDGQERLNDEMRGIVNMRELVSRVTGVLARHLDAQQAVFFLFDDKSDTLRCVGGFGVSDQPDRRRETKLGEGLVGQAAADREPIIVEQVPDDYVRIHSGLGEAHPRGLAVFPLCYNERLLGVIELAAVAPFDERRIAFAGSVAESISIALIASERQSKLTTALDEGERINFLSDIALELSDCAYWHIDYSDPEYYHMSERAARMLGEPLNEDGRYHLEDEWFSRLLEADPEAAAKTSELYQGAIDGKYDQYDSTYAYKRPVDGEIIWLHAAGSIVRGEDDKIQFMYGVYQDITEHVRSAEALRKSEERFDLAVRGSGDGLWDHNPETGEMWFSDRFREMLGYSSVEEYPNLAESWSN
ncbi:MAG: GAF domain-containing protein [Verrucomicrobiales bacterium]